MKTMKLKNGLPIRVKERDVNTCLKTGYNYCPKSEYKTLVRGVKAEKESVETIEQPAQKKKKYQRQKRS